MSNVNLKKGLDLRPKSDKNLLKSESTKSLRTNHERCTKCVDAPSIRRTLKAPEPRKKPGESALIESLDIDDDTNLPRMPEKFCKCEALARALKVDLASVQGMSNRRADIDAMCDMCKDGPVCKQPQPAESDQKKDEPIVEIDKNEKIEKVEKTEKNGKNVKIVSKK